MLKISINLLVSSFSWKVCKDFFKPFEYFFLSRDTSRKLSTFQNFIGRTEKVENFLERRGRKVWKYKFDDESFFTQTNFSLRELFSETTIEVVE